MRLYSLAGRRVDRVDEAIENDRVEVVGPIGLEELVDRPKRRLGDNLPIESLDLSCCTSDFIDRVARPDVFVLPCNRDYCGGGQLVLNDELLRLRN